MFIFVTPSLQPFGQWVAILDEFIFKCFKNNFGFTCDQAEGALASACFRSCPSQENKLILRLLRCFKIGEN